MNNSTAAGTGTKSAKPARSAKLEPLKAPSVERAEGPVVLPSRIDQIPITLTVELGRVQIELRRLKAIGQDDVLPLDRPIGDPVDIRANGNLVAKGEIVATEGERYGVRITKLVQSGADPMNGGA